MDLFESVSFLLGIKGMTVGAVGLVRIVFSNRAAPMQTCGFSGETSTSRRKSFLLSAAVIPRST